MKLTLKLSTSDCERLEKDQRIIKGVLRTDELAGVVSGSHVMVTGCVFMVRVQAIRPYQTFRELVLNEGMRWVAREAQDIAQAVTTLQGRTRDEDVARSGVLAIALEKA